MIVEVNCPNCNNSIPVEFKPNPEGIPCPFCLEPIQIIAPQEGPQWDFIHKCSDVDIAVYGGAAGGAKTYGLLLDPLKYVENPGFRATIFRRTSTQIRFQGGLWDDSLQIYPAVGAVPKESTLEWFFPSGAKIKFGHMEHEGDRFKYDGAQMAYIGFDQGEQFTKQMVFYLLSRARSVSGVKPIMRLTVNPPDPNEITGQWLHRFLAPWVSDKFPNPAKPGEKRYFIQKENGISWVDRETHNALSVTFIPAKLQDNKMLMEKDPGYLDKLMALEYHDRERLLHGSWNILAIGQMFKRAWFRKISPEGFRRIALNAGRKLKVIRVWDRAATEGGGCRTAGLKIGILDGQYYCVDMKLVQLSSKGVNDLQRETANEDGRAVEIYEEQEPGSSGKAVSDWSRRATFAGFTYHPLPARQDPITRARPAASAAEGGNIFVVDNGPWVEPFLDEAAMFPNGDFADQIAVLAWGVIALGQKTTGMGNIDNVPILQRPNIDEMYTGNIRPSAKTQFGRR